MGIYWDNRHTKPSPRYPLTWCVTKDGCQNCSILAFISDNFQIPDTYSVTTYNQRQGTEPDNVQQLPHLGVELWAAAYYGTGSGKREEGQGKGKVGGRPEGEGGEGVGRSEQKIFVNISCTFLSCKKIHFRSTLWRQYFCLLLNIVLKHVASLSRYVHGLYNTKLNNVENLGTMFLNILNPHYPHDMPPTQNCSCNKKTKKNRMHPPPQLTVSKPSCPLCNLVIKLLIIYTETLFTQEILIGYFGFQHSVKLDPMIRG